MLMLGHLHVGVGYPCRTVAELSNNHNGSVDRAIKLVDAAIGAGADAIKLQAYTPDELVQLRGDGPAPAQWGAQGWTMRTLYEQAQTSREILRTVARYCTDNGVPWFSSVFGTESLRVLEDLGCPAYKIARLDNAHGALASAILETGKPVLVSAARHEMPLVLEVKGAPTFRLYCPPGYPARIEDVHLPHFALRLVGLSSHCLAPELPVAAVARGCKLVEMHFQLRDEPSALEANLSLDENQWEAMVESIRRTEALLA